MVLLFGTCQDFNVGFNFYLETSIKERYSSKKKKKTFLQLLVTKKGE